jgi:two-component system cell cycle sensor histidine kinase/response regulator CckA
MGMADDLLGRDEACEPTRAESGPGCVLVVEDDPMLRRVVVRTLRNWGYSILEAPDGGAALDQIGASESILSVILLDIMLPVLSGVEVARRVLRDCPSLPIVACSAAMNEQVESDLRDAGVRHFLPKPYSADSLRDTLHRARVG